MFGWLVTEGRDTVSKYCTPPGRVKGEMTEEEAWPLPERPSPARDISRPASIVPGGMKLSAGSRVIIVLRRVADEEVGVGVGLETEDAMAGGRRLGQNGREKVGTNMM